MEEFVWTSASSDHGSESDDSDIVENGDDKESEPDKAYKKKLQNKLLNQQIPVQNQENGKHSPKKRKHLNNTMNRQSESPKREEPASNAETSACHKKLELKSSSEDTTGEEFDDSYLNLRIKQEKESRNHKLHKKDMSESDSSVQSDVQNHSKSKKKKAIDRLSVDASHNMSQDALSDTTRKKKSKRKDIQEQNNDNKDSIVEDMFSAEETVIEQQNNHSKQIIANKSREYCEDNNLRDGSNANLNVSIPQQQNDNQTISERVYKTSERIRFEDDEEEGKPSEKQGHFMSTKLKYFVKYNPNLRAVSLELPHEAIITNDDEVWIIRCPSEITAQSFQGVGINIDDKCKLKVNGQTYNGSIEKEPNRVAILTYEDDKNKLKSITINGTINFRKRIPKAHSMDENVSIINQTDFIPLPETKNRHPLFGPDYKKAIKLSSAVVGKLRGSEEGTNHKKKLKHESMECDGASASEPALRDDPEPIVDPEFTAHAKKKKKKKRQLSAAEVEVEPDAPKKKRSKHALESAGAWDSEQTIQQNLFDF